ncbi:MAG: putative nucleotide-diphospho-sugar transferase [Marinoscillum sp.]
MLDIVSIYNNYFKDFKINLDNSLKSVGIGNQRVYHHYSKIGIADFGSDNFRNLTIEKISVIRKSLEMSERVLFLDNDVYLVKNPISYFEEFLGDSEILFQDDCNEFVHRGKRYPVLNTGVLYIKKTANTLALFDPDSIHLKEIGRRENDQNILNRRVLDLEINFKVLPKELFPCGKLWYNGEADDRPYLVHYNWLAGKKAKIAKMKSYGHWKVNPFYSFLSFVEAKVKYEWERRLKVNKK